LVADTRSAAVFAIATGDTAPAASGALKSTGSTGDDPPHPLHRPRPDQARRRPLEEIGPALEEGKRFTLTIDGAWRDAEGKPLKDAFRKNFEAGPPDRAPPDPAQWEVRPPGAASREPIVVTFPERMDHALARRLIRVVAPSGDAVAGNVAPEVGERRWVFTPDLPWHRKGYSIVAQATIEDLAGNNIGKPFEVDLAVGIAPDVPRAVTAPVRTR
jgi:hypothetical protein